MRFASFQSLDDDGDIDDGAADDTDNDSISEIDDGGGGLLRITYRPVKDCWDSAFRSFFFSRPPSRISSAVRKCGGTYSGPFQSSDSPNAAAAAAAVSLPGYCFRTSSFFSLSSRNCTSTDTDGDFLDGTSINTSFIDSMSIDTEELADD